MDVSLFNFQLPEERIALRPASPRDCARMMVVHVDGRIEHRHMHDLPDYLRPADALVVNDTRVFPARLRGHRVREAGPANIEILLHRRLASNKFSALARPARKLLVGDTLIFDMLQATVSARTEDGGVEIDFAVSGAELDAAITEHGEIPLPPYIVHKRRPDGQDVEDYQTIFANQTGSAAAPTAGLHFTPELLARLDNAGIARETVTLHVGLGTFLPVTVQDTGAHRMHSERARIDDTTAVRLNAIHSQGGRILAVGTTSLRVLESAADEKGLLHDLDCDTDIFITPGYHFRATDMLLTNFHLPQSTLFMLVAAFKGLGVMQAAYAEAIEQGYRFYSYGDACLLIRAA